MAVIRIKAQWDADARVWVATSDDIPLVTEAESVEALMNKLPSLIQDMLDDGPDTDVPFELVAHHASTVKVRCAA